MDNLAGREPGGERCKWVQRPLLHAWDQTQDGGGGVDDRYIMPECPSRKSDPFKGFGGFPVSGHFTYSREFVVSPVSRHFQYSSNFVVSAVYRHFCKMLEDWKVGKGWEVSIGSNVPILLMLLLMMMI